MNTSHFMLTDGAGLDQHADTSDLAVISFSRREVERGLVGDAADRLMSLSDRANRVSRYEGMVLLEFTGFDDDPREIAGISECRSFFTALTSAWPFWFHFLPKGRWQDVEQITLAIALLVPVTVLAPEAGVNRLQLDRRDVARQVERLCAAMGALHAMHGVPMAEATAIAQRINAVLAKAYG